MKKQNLKSMILFFILVFIEITNASKTHLLKGNDLYRTGKFKDAYFEYQNALKNGENKVMARFNMANSLYQLKQVGRALLIYENLMKSTPTFTRPYINAGGIYFSLDEIGNAIQLYDRVLKIDSTNTTALKMLGECWIKLNDRSKALEYFERGRKLEPLHTSWIYAIIDIHLSIGDYASARDELKRAILENGETPNLVLYLAEMEIAMNENVAAAGHLQQVINLDPDRKEAWNRLAQLHETMKNPYLAIMVLKEGTHSGYMDDQSLIDLGRLYTEVGQIRQARNTFTKAAQKGIVGAKEGFLQLAWKMREQGLVSMSKKILQEALVLFPADGEVLAYLEK